MDISSTVRSYSPVPWGKPFVGLIVIVLVIIGLNAAFGVTTKAKKLLGG